MKQHIFLVEDDDSLRESIETLLRFSGYFVQSFSNPAALLATSIQVAPAIVLSDMRMPGMSGIELQKALLDRGRNIPFVFISAESTLSQGITAMKQGAVDFLIKPFEREELLAVVIKAMERDMRQIQAFIQQNKQAQALDRLSRREKETYALLVQGYGNQQIMDAMGIGLYTVKQYKAEVMRKLGAQSLAELIEFHIQQKSKG
jgi:two-component system response regulator TtrR